MGNIICYILIGILFIFVFVLLVRFLQMKAKIGYLERRYQKLLQGNSVSNLEAIILRRFAEIDTLKKSTKTVLEALNGISEMCQNSIQKTGIVKYDAFDDIGGELSFALALLDRRYNGVILNVIHGKDGCYTYSKEVVNGKVFVELSIEEKKALNDALKESRPDEESDEDELSDSED